jgi:tetratricopeptide (TPR) repeat protein
MQAQLDKAKNKLSSASAPERAKLKASIDDLNAKIAKTTADIDNANKDIDKGFENYDKALSLKPGDRNLTSEIATNYYTFKRYDKAAQTWATMIDPNTARPEDYMKVGRAYYNGEKYKTADSVFNSVMQKSPDFVPAYLWTARTYSKMDPDSKMGLAKPKFENLIEVTKADSLKYASEMMESFGYLGYYYMLKDNYNSSKEYYDRMIAFDPNNKDFKINGYNGLGTLELRMAGNEKTNEGRLPFLEKSAEDYNKILAIDPNNVSAKNQLNYVHEFEAQVKKGINPNEIKGVVKDAANGQVIAYASIRVKDTAAENLTNAQGEFKFEIPQGSEVLIISAKGYKSIEIPITKSRVYNVSLSK